MKAGDVSLAIAFISGMPKPLVVNDGVMVFVDRGQCLNELPMDPFSTIRTSLIQNSCKVIAIPTSCACADDNDAMMRHDSTSFLNLFL